MSVTLDPSEKSNDSCLSTKRSSHKTHPEVRWSRWTSSIHGFTSAHEIETPSEHMLLIWTSPTLTTPGYLSASYELLCLIIKKTLAKHLELKYGNAVGCCSAQWKCMQHIEGSECISILFQVQQALQATSAQLKRMHKVPFSYTWNCSVQPLSHLDTP